MLYDISYSYRILIQAIQRPDGEFIGYFTIFLSTADLTKGQPHYCEDRRKITASLSLIEALNLARERGVDWIKEDQNRALALK